MSLGRSIVFFVCLSVVVTAVGGGAIAASDYSIEATQHIDTPPKTFTVSGESWTVTSVGYVDAGNTLSFTVNTPGDSLATINLYNSDKQIVDSKRAPSDGTYSFDTGSLSPGTYVLTLSVDGSIQTIHPVVVSGYSFNVQAPNSVTAGENIEIKVELTETSGTPSSVDVVLLNETWQQDMTATKIGENTYSVIVSKDLSAGSYQFYAGTRGTDTIDGRKELTGISRAQTLNVEAKTTTTSQNTDGSSSSSQTTSSSTSSTPTSTTTVTTTTSPTKTTTNTPTKTTTNTPKVTTTSSPSKTTAPTATDTATDTPTVTTETTSGSNVIKPNPTETTSTTTPGFTIGIAVVSLAALLFYRT